MMRQKQQWLQNVVIVVALIFAGAALPRVAQAQPKATATLLATVQSLDGELEVQRPGADAADLTQSAPLYAGDVANTGSSSKATFNFDEGTLLQLNANTMLELTAPRQVGGGRRSFFRLIKGEIFVRTKALLAVQTRSATVAVRGTAFRLTVDEQGVTTLTVIEGVVDFFNALGAVMVRADEQSTARLNSAPTRPMPLPGAAYELAWTRELDRAQLSNSQTSPTRAKLTAVAPRHTSFLGKVLPALIIGVIIGVVTNNDDNPRTRQRPTTGQGYPTRR